MKTPDVTPVQAGVAAAVALVQAILVTLGAFGIDLTTAQQVAITGNVTALGAVLVIADVLLRRKRADQIENITWAQQAPKPVTVYEPNPGAVAIPVEELRDGNLGAFVEKSQA